MINLCYCNTGNGWFLNKIVINYKEGNEGKEVVFPCNRYVICGETGLVHYTLDNLGKNSSEQAYTHNLDIRAMPWSFSKGQGCKILLVKTKFAGLVWEGECKEFTNAKKPKTGKKVH